MYESCLLLQTCHKNDIPNFCDRAEPEGLPAEHWENLFHALSPDRSDSET